MLIEPGPSILREIAPNEVAWIGILVRSKTHGHKAIVVDKSDLESTLSVGKWSAVKAKYDVFYAERKSKATGRSTTQRLHNFITGKIGIDHINGNGLDNRRENLRHVTQAENGQNVPSQKRSKTGIRGVWWCKLTNKWAVSVRHGKTYHFGRYESIEEAELVAIQARSVLLPASIENRDDL